MSLQVVTCPKACTLSILDSLIWSLSRGSSPGYKGEHLNRFVDHAALFWQLELACVLVYVYITIYVYNYTHLEQGFVLIYIYTHIHIYIYIFIYLFIFIYLYNYTHLYTCFYSHKWGVIRRVTIVMTHIRGLRTPAFKLP